LKKVDVFLRLRKMKDKGVTECAVVSCPLLYDIKLHAWLPRPVLLRTLAHEMVHVKQYIMGEMTALSSDKNGIGRVQWKSRVVDEYDINYRSLPWEKEAYRMERPLYRSYCKHIKKFKFDF